MITLGDFLCGPVVKTLCFHGWGRTGLIHGWGAKIHMSCSVYQKWVISWFCSKPPVTSLGHSSVQSPSCVQLFVTPRTAARQAFLSITNSWSLPKLMSIESAVLSNHLILCCPLLLMSSIFPSIRVISNELVLRIRWPKYWCFIFSISLSNEYSGLISFRMGWLAFLAAQGTLRSVHQHHN